MSDTATAVRYEFPDSQSLAVHARLFTHFFSARVIVAGFLLTVAVRVAMGRWAWHDFIGPLVILALEPFIEWGIHVYLLHARRNFYVAVKHRAHHQEPRNVELVLLPARVPLLALPIAAVITALVGGGDYPGAVGTLAFGFLMLLMYEWTHFLIHSKYRPRRWWFRTQWRNHRNHHFRNENYWFCVTNDLADRALRTAPDRDAVPVSPTAKDLAARWS